MEWMNRAGRPGSNPGQTVTPASAAGPAPAHHANNKKKSKGVGFHHISMVTLLFSVTLLTVAVISFLMLYRQNDESRFVDEGKYQAVFLNGGQVYFGKVRALNNKYVGMTDIYYLRVNQQVQPKQGETAKQDIALVKLGCELHGPQDQMLINRDQMVFWENLKDDAQVTKAIAQYKQQNPGPQKCDTNSSSNSNSNSNTNNNANTNNNNNNAETETPTTSNP